MAASCHCQSRTISLLLLLVQLCLLVISALSVKDSVTRTFEIDYKNNTFLKDGKPFRYISGSLHYSRIPPYYWKDRLMKMRAAGLNTVQFYVPWNVHELQPGQFYWEGNSDLVQFVKLAQQSDLLVLIRLGPYIDGEWEFGGFPAWLLTEDQNMFLRTSYPSYISWVDKWYSALLAKIQPLVYSKGGPVIMVQIENEYGSYFDVDETYKNYLYYKVKANLGDDIVIYTTDGCGMPQFSKGVTKGAYGTVDFGSDSNATECFNVQRFFEPQGPLVNSEYYTGWLDHWGEKHSTRTISAVAQGLDRILALGASVNMYTFCGGTNFGFMSGANSPPYQPVPTSYDYDAPLNEAGDVTDKYFAIRNVISKYVELPPMPIPPNSNKTKYGKIPMEFASTIQDALPYFTPTGPVKSTYPVPMEKLKFYSGFIMYRSALKKEYKTATALHSMGIKDRAIVMVNSRPFGILDRQNTTVNITGTIGQNVDILVENQGRIAFGTNINFNNKGIVGNVTLDGDVVTDWSIYPIYLDNINVTLTMLQKRSAWRSKPLKSADGSLMTPSIYVGQIDIPVSSDHPQDTFLDPQSWGKGQAFLNDFNFGRYWPRRGPQVTLYIPKPVFNIPPAMNHLYLLELEAPPCPEASNQDTCFVTLTDQPNIDAPVGPDSPFSN